MWTNMSLFTFLCFIVAIVEAVDKDKDDEDENNRSLEGKQFEELYAIGKEAYLANDWQNCIKYVEAAIKDFKEFDKVVIGCKRKCRNETWQSGEKLSEVDIEGLHFFEVVVRNTLCLLKCKKQHFKDKRIEQITDSVMEDFEKRVPYDYLQLCYFQMTEYQKAANAAFTHFVVNQDNDIMKDNLDFYLDHTGAKREELINYEAKPYVQFFLDGTEAYRNRTWSSVIENMEAAIKSYLDSEEECRFACEKPFNMGWFPDFVSSISNHFTFCLRCKLRCPEKLSNLNGEIIEDVFALAYHFLQFAYYTTGNLQSAAECVESYLLFNPDDPDMQANKVFYSKMPDIQAEWFEARPEAVYYKRRHAYETKVMQFIENSFVFDDFEPLHVGTEDRPQPPPPSKVEL